MMTTSGKKEGGSPPIETPMRSEENSHHHDHHNDDKRSSDGRLLGSSGFDAKQDSRSAGDSTEDSTHENFLSSDSEEYSGSEQDPDVYVKYFGGNTYDRNDSWLADDKATTPPTARSAGARSKKELAKSLDMSTGELDTETASREELIEEVKILRVDVETASRDELVREIHKLRVERGNAVRTNLCGFIRERSQIHGSGPESRDSPLSHGSPGSDSSSVTAGSLVSGKHSFLGKGGFGTVFRARGSLDQKLVAVKEIPFQADSRAKYIERMKEAEREACIHASIPPHMNIVEYLYLMLTGDDMTKEGGKSPTKPPKIPETVAEDDSFEEGFETPTKSGQRSDIGSISVGSDSDEDESVVSSSAFPSTSSYDSHWTSSTEATSQNPKFQGKAMIVMELCNGGNLRKDIGGCGVEDPGERLKRALELVLGALRGVAHMHAHEILHRDVKPENIFVVKKNAGREVTKLGDFGLSCEVGDKSTLGGKYGIGTPFYSSPETLAGKAHGKPCDVSCGLGDCTCEPPLPLHSLNSALLALCSLRYTPWALCFLRWYSTSIRSTRLKYCIRN